MQNTQNRGKTVQLFFVALVLTANEFLGSQMVLPSLLGGIGLRVKAREAN